MKRVLDKSTMLGRAVRYGIAGVAATLVYYGLVAAFVEMGLLTPVLAAAVATSLVTVLQYLVNRRWIFVTDRSHASAFSRYVMASTVGIVMNTGLMYLAVQLFDWKYWAGLLLATLVVPPTNFLINNHWTFRPTI